MTKFLDEGAQRNGRLAAWEVDGAICAECAELLR
jgi:hypothetical protein